MTQHYTNRRSLLYFYMAMEGKTLKVMFYDESGKRHEMSRTATTVESWVEHLTYKLHANISDASLCGKVPKLTDWKIWYFLKHCVNSRGVNVTGDTGDASPAMFGQPGMGMSYIPKVYHCCFRYCK